jgi:hypothetical protein
MSYGFMVLLGIAAGFMHGALGVLCRHKSGAEECAQYPGGILSSGRQTQCCLLSLLCISLLGYAVGCSRQVRTARIKRPRNNGASAASRVSRRRVLNHTERTSYAKNMAIDRYIKPAGQRMVYGKRTRHAHASADGLWPVPEGIVQELNKAEVYYVESVMQPKDSNTCGSRCIANALAISEMFGKKAFSARAIYERSRVYDYLHKRNNMSSSTVAKMAKSMGLDHVHVLEYCDYDILREHQPKQNPFTCISSTEYGFCVNLYEEEAIQKKIVRTIRHASDIIVHFICALQPVAGSNVGHWVSVSVIKGHNQKPMMIYMDSCNIPLEQEPQSQAYLSYLYWQCIA